jgi:ligand-binding SRPBCC domain-containing protein
MSKVTLTTELPMPAEAAGALARKPELMKYVLSPVLRSPGMTVPDHIDVGTTASARLWWFGIIPTWKHHLTVKQLDATEIYSHEYGGPVHTWNHRLTFTPIDEGRCRYTDEIETDNGLRGLMTGLFIRLMFRYRHHRWRRLARILA